MGKKYIIELEEPEMFDEQKYYQCSQMPWWAVSENIVENLTPYTEPDMEQVRKEAYDKGYDDATAEIGSDEQAIAEKAYQRGLADAWEAARKICTNWVLPDSVLSEIFGMDKTIDDIMKESTASEAIEKIRQYEQEKEEKIQVGDEVEAVSGKAVIIEVLGNGKDVRYMYPDAQTGFNDSCNVKKTGRHFPEIAEVLQKMKES